MPSPPWALHTCSSAAAQSLCLFKAPATTEIYTLSLHDALPIFTRELRSLAPDVVGLQEASIARGRGHVAARLASALGRSEEHTSELQSRRDLVCRLLLEKKKTIKHAHILLRDTSKDSKPDRA